MIAVFFVAHFEDPRSLDTMSLMRRGWDSNPRSHQGETTDFESAPFDHSGTSPFLIFPPYHAILILSFFRFVVKCNYECFF